MGCNIMSPDVRYIFEERDEQYTARGSFDIVSEIDLASFFMVLKI